MMKRFASFFGLLATCASLSAGILADFSRAFPPFQVPDRHSRGIRTERFAEEGKQYLLFSGNPVLSPYGELILNSSGKILPAKEFAVEVELFLPERHSVLIFALHFLDARGKRYVFNRDLQGMGGGARTVLFRFSPDAENADAASRKNGPMKFPIRFRGFGVLFQGKEPGDRNRVGIGKIDLVKGMDDFAAAWLSVKPKILFPDPFYHTAPVLRNGRLERKAGELRMTLPKGTSRFETTKRNNTYPAIQQFRLDLELVSGSVSVRPVVLDASFRRYPCDPVVLAPGRRTCIFAGKTDRAARPPFHYGLEFLSHVSGTVLKLYDIHLAVPMRMVDAFEVSGTPQKAGLILPGTKDRCASICFRNNLQTKTPVRIELVLRDSFQILHREEHHAVVAPGESLSFRMPERKRCGIYYIDYRLSIPGREGIRKGRNSFAVLNPSGPFPEDGRFLFGICYHAQRFSPEELNLAGRVLSSIGIRALRNSMEWGRIQRDAESPFRFDSFDERKRIFDHYGIRFMATVGNSPAWADRKNWIPFVPKHSPRAAGKKWPGKVPPDPAAFRRWIHAAVEYGRKNVLLIESWNEPEHFGSANFSPEECAELQKIVYEETKRIAPEILVTTPGFTRASPNPVFTDPRYAEKVLRAAKGYYDVIAHHGHDSFDLYRRDIRYLLELRKKIGIEQIPWIAGETGIPSVNLTEYEQGTVLFRKLIYAFANGAIGYFWYDLKNDGTDPFNAEHNFGLFTYDFQPKAAFVVYNTLTSVLKRAEFERDCSMNEFSLYRFRSGGESIYAFWNDSSVTPVRLLWLEGAAEAETVDVFGNVASLRTDRGIAQVEIGSQPGFLRLKKGNGKSRMCPVWSLLHATLKHGAGASVALEFRNPFSRMLEFRICERTFGIPANSVSRQSFHGIPAGEQGRIVLPLEIRELGLRSQIILKPVPVLTVPDTGFRASPDLLLDRADQMHRLTLNIPGMHDLWKGKDDFSMRVFFRRSSDSLILKCVVSDDIHFQPYQGAEVWRGDNIQLLLAVPGQAGIWEIGFTCRENRNSEVFFWSRGIPGETPEKIRLKTERREAEKQTVYEAEIPWRALGMDKAPAFLRFNLLGNENDGSGRKLQAALAGDSRNPIHFRILSFE